MWALDAAAVLGRNESERNALQHCMWAAIMTADMSTSAAMGFLSRHERGGPRDRDWRADVRNNSVGISIGRRTRGRGLVAGACLRALNGGKLNIRGG